MEATVLVQASDQENRTVVHPRTLHQAATAKKMKKGEMGLADGKNAYVLDAAELGKTAWEEI